MSAETIFNEYETTFIMRPELGEDVYTRVVEKLLAIIERFEGELFVNDPWGRRQLAYPIQRHNYGYYVYFNYAGPADLPHELERIIRLDDSIIRFLTVKIDDAVDAEEARPEAVSRHQKWVERRNVQEERRHR